MDLRQCINCGHDGYTSHELKRGLCPDCQDEEVMFEDCPKCGRHYDEVDQEYQCCSKCGWDAENDTWTKARDPQQSDYLNGEADILTGQWY